jgi:GNAT superfamily N-acetyltransferase
MTHPHPSPSIEIRPGYEPGVIGRIGELHGRYYAVAWGSGAAFEMQMLRELCDFVEAYDPRTCLLLTAHDGDVMVGSLAVMLVSGTRTARLRFVIVDPAWQGHGIGKRLLQAALTWCRDRDLETCFLWTVEGLPASRGMYEAAGFKVVERVDDARYTVPRTSIRMVLAINSQPTPNSQGTPDSQLSSRSADPRVSKVGSWELEVGS